MSRWYGQGGDWINHGLPNYVAIDRKPENGCEIQNSACGRSGVLLRLKLVKTAEEEQQHTTEDDNGLLHGTVVLKQLLEPWFYSDRIVCADSYFASVGAAKELLKYRLRFIGVVKTATKFYPMQYLGSLVLSGRGDRKGLVAANDNGQPYLLAFVWVDRERRYFISSASSLQEGTPYVRQRWRQLVQDDITDPENVQLTVQQPKACEVYYSCCAKIDQHNRDRQDTLQLERKFKTKNWATCVNHSIFVMIVVDTWKVYSNVTINSNGECMELQKEF
jgi:hypothetical protein